MLYDCVVTKRCHTAPKVIVFTDGAMWLKKMKDENFPDALHILDWYHAVDHLWTTAHALYGEVDHERCEEWEYDLGPAGSITLLKGEGETIQAYCDITGNYGCGPDDVVSVIALKSDGRIRGIHEGKTTLFFSTPIPSISTSTVSPTPRGPTPAGVPVMMTSPGRRVMIPEMKDTRS